MTIHKLTSTDAFVVFDLDGAPCAGITRCAPKILVDGATLLARSLTYRFASFERKVGGASAGINAKPDLRADALTAYVAEVTPLVAEGRFLTEAGKGVGPDELSALRAVDPRPATYWADESALTALGVAVAADLASGGLDGRSVAIEGFDAAGSAIAREVVARGGRVVAVSTADGAVIDTAGLHPDRLAEAWDAHGAALVTALAPGGPDGTAAPGGPGQADPVAKPWAVFGAAADVLVVGSKAGVIDDKVAAGLAAKVVVPSGPVPVTAKALAALRRAGVVVVPDFLSTAGPMFAGWPDPAGADPAATAADAVAASLTEVLGHADGPLLGACLRAEAFLATWQDTLPFGRPLA